jgi:hypothetical protein
MKKYNKYWLNKKDRFNLLLMLADLENMVKGCINIDTEIEQLIGQAKEVVENMDCE